ncbi:sufE-like protein 2, chloroplastic [Syzygium oleosum]|uniref:sufE-like protein 2, chloroplastic n=1 Tax=Syzygium oleosum TaxID=219896 RepID=UPI0024B97897|nr:sufE-like protein 2, chloroplastic [Syzygium oleosum]
MNSTSSAPASASSSLRFPSARPPGPRRRFAAPPSSIENIRSRVAASSLGLDGDAPGSPRPSRPLPGAAAAPDRLRRLASEFRSLAEPIDRVKRLLHYAAILPPFDESARLDANRVAGCATRVWLDVGTYGEPRHGGGRGGGGRMRFRADSDSEISKGFCSCLIWALDEAEPEEVIAVRAEDLAAINVGVVAHSRANTWQNVLTSMQKRTEALIKERSAESDLERPEPAEVTSRCDSPDGTRCPCQQEA